MSENNKRRPILFNGQVYSRPVTKSSGGGGKPFPRTFLEARESILKDLEETKSTLRNLPKSSRMPNEIVLSLVMHHDFTAKSYYPKSLFDLPGSEKFGLQEIGSRVWRNKENLVSENDEAVSRVSKMFFIRATEGSIQKFEEHINSNEIILTKTFVEDIRKISSIGLLSGENQILGITDEWNGGRLEAVLHPFDIDKEKTLNHFLKYIENFGVNIDDVRYKQYFNGVTFVSFQGDRKMLDLISNYNPLRTIHPLKIRELPSYDRSYSASNGPKVPLFTKKSPIIVGVIDGGIDVNNPYLLNYAESEFPMKGDPVDSFLSHGTQVSGAVLYGALNNFSSSDVLPEPMVSVKSFGVLSSSTSDPDLYDVIDAIENFVPSNKNISVYNLSIGPHGPILDDSISRFTYACDLLSYEHNVLFCVAVGNDGELIGGYNRIQSPSDSVNCLAVGAYTNNKGVVVRAPYSSIGPGREGSKMKPDIMAFGGCDQHPIHLISEEGGKKILSAGTSFASPIVAGIAGRLIGESKGNIDPLIAKALLIHSTREKSSQHTFEMGHGAVSESIDELINCKDKSYTLIYRGELEVAKYAEFMIPWDSAIDKGSTTFRWTVAVLSDVDHLCTDDYTSSAVEVAFYSNNNKYMFKNKFNTILDGTLKKSEIVDVEQNPERADYLMANGWTKGQFPVTNSAKKQFKTESDLRDDLKWDTLDTREKNVLSKGVKNPAFHIHALGRGSRLEDLKVKFVLVLSVTSPKSEIDLYSSVLLNFPALLPIELESQINIDVNTNLT